MALLLNRFKISLLIDALKTTGGDIGGARDQFPFSKEYTFQNGVGALQAEEFWTGRRTLAATTSENIDLTASLVSSTGQGTTITFKKIKGIFIFHETPAASAELRVGGHATGALPIFGSVEGLDTDQPYHIVRPGGMLPLVYPDAAGITVTATTGDQLKVHNAAAAEIVYAIIILGTIT